MSLLRALQLRIEILESQGDSSEAKRASDRLFEELKKGSTEGGSAVHPELGIFYMNLGIDYVDLAQKYLRSGDFTGAKAALERLEQVLPELSASDRETLTESYRKLQARVLTRKSVGHQ
jgi:tetratricopeptide (TPR) repeat protein